MDARWIAVIAAVGLFSLPALAGAAPQLAATGVRIVDQPAFVRVVVDFNGKVPARQVGFEGLSARLGAVSISRPVNTTHRKGKTRHGVRVRFLQGFGPNHALHIRTHFARHRFKYLSYAVVTGNRLAINLWKSAPPRKPIHTCSRLTLGSYSESDGKAVSVRGHEHGIFENQFRVVVRGADGEVLGHRTVTGPGKWTAKVPYHVAHSQDGTVEAVAFSAKDGALECLAQHYVRLPAT
ncbi:MAG TPA: Gmad2 immunoglobulin-like domain-containing protein [Gaiellaceae bacterium]|jgi:hypothetical protein